MTPGHCSSVGVPNSSKILKIISISHSPWKRGFRVSISADKLTENGADAPDVNGGTVYLLPQKDLRRPVPQRNHLMRQAGQRNGEGTCQTEVSYLDIAIPVNQDILRLEVSMYNPVAVAIKDPFQHLLCIMKSLFGADLSFLHQLLQIEVDELENQVDLPALAVLVSLLCPTALPH